MQDGFTNPETSRRGSEGIFGFAGEPAGRIHAASVSQGYGGSLDLQQNRQGVRDIMDRGFTGPETSRRGSEGMFEPLAEPAGRSYAARVP
jgi:hypothetical protein